VSAGAGWIRGMDKKPPIPPQHRHYPRAHPIPVRPSPAPRPGEQAAAGGAPGWPRSVPEGRRFPRS
jgi:hypothetical protein